MTKEQYERLQPFERQLRNAAVSSFVRFSRGELGKVASVYEDMYHTKMGSKINCSACVLNMMKTLYKDYMKYEDWYNKRFRKSESE